MKISVATIVSVLTVLSVVITYAVSRNLFPAWTTWLLFAGAIISAVIAQFDKTQLVKLKKKMGLTHFKNF